MGAVSPDACSSAFTAALIGRDIGAALDLLTEEAVFFFSNGAVVQGKEAFAALMTSSWRLIATYDYASREARWIVRSDAAAVLVYGFSWSGTVGGTPAGGSGRGTRVFRPDGDGAWLLVHEHLSAGAPASPD
jgi:ketosteroid isomerase-like protein